jgi:hypothetical protein
MNTLVHTTTSTLTATTEGLDIPAPLRTTPADRRPVRVGSKSDLSFRTTDGERHLVEVKRAPMCSSCGCPVTSRTHKAHA